MEQRVRANVSVENQDFVLYTADLEHLEQAIVSLKKAGHYTAAERVAVVRSLVAAYFVDAEPSP